MSPTLLSTLTLLFVSFTHNVNASWRMDSANLLTARMDPLVSPNGVSGHVHDVAGGNNFAATYDFNTLRQSSCSSVSVQDDKSNYWAPALYYKHRDTGKFELVPVDWAVYYLHRGSETNIQQFPEGFRMIAGSPSRSAMSSDPSDKAFNYRCLSYNEAPIPETYELPKRRCPNGVRIQIMFPSCWNGKDVTSANFKDHVSYPVGTQEGGTCPPTHPVRLMTIFLEQIAHTEKFEYYDGGFVLATGDNVGYSSHADFQNGWDASPNSVLQQAINTCTDAQARMSECAVLKASISDVYKTCRPNSKMPVEDVGIYGDLSVLPGDNPVWGGNVKKVLTGVSNNPPWGSPYSTLPSGWVKHGCIDEGNIYVNAMTGDKWVDDNMYPGICVDHCNSKGFSLAGLEAGKECYCANELTNGGSMNLVDQSACSWVCPGSLYEFCGGSRKITLYKKTGDTTDVIDSIIYPPVGSKLKKVYTSDGTSSPVLVAPVNSILPTNSETPTNSVPSSTTTSVASDTPLKTSTPSIPDIPPSSNPPSNSNISTATTTIAPSTTTSAPVCKNGKPAKRRRSFRKRKLVEPFHVPAKHRRMHH